MHAFESRDMRIPWWFQLGLKSDVSSLSADGNWYVLYEQRCQIRQEVDPLSVENDE